ncbi:transcriptional regulator with XRE-family HTH domain [Pseudorhodoferax soli]|uniref:Transcriptional regulator with XRE-family HTH domain n=2 Tax=Pseudorhodoferax soli TaxID=545864 RepID=A0A368XU91_9BURK|nr:transcriptional regulator with XRE-family HTH domain [Pseudorhodoferax soli]
MRDRLPPSALMLRMRFGATLKGRRQDLGFTQGDIAERLGIEANMVSQVERGVTALPMHDLQRWAAALRMPKAALADRFAFYNLPDFYCARYNKDPYAVEELARPALTARSAPGRPAERGARDRREP